MVLLNYFLTAGNTPLSGHDIYLFLYVISLQEKYEEATAALAEMEKRVVMAESMLEATLQYQTGQMKTQPSPR